MNYSDKALKKKSPQTYTKIHFEGFKKANTTYVKESNINLTSSASTLKEANLPHGIVQLIAS